MNGEKSLLPPSLHPGILVGEHVIASQIRARQCIWSFMQCLAFSAAKALATTRGADPTKKGYS